MRIAGAVKIIAPRQWRVFGGQHGIFITLKNAVAVFLRPVLAPQELRVRLLQLFQFFGEVCRVHVNSIGGKIFFRAHKIIGGNGPLLAAVRQLPAHRELRGTARLPLADFKIIVRPTLERDGL